MSTMDYGDEYVTRIARAHLNQELAVVARTYQARHKVARVRAQRNLLRQMAWYTALYFALAAVGLLLLAVHDPTQWTTLNM